MDLRDLATGYLEAEGYDVKERNGGLLEGRRAAIGRDERILVWTPSEEAARTISRRLGYYIGQFGEWADRAPQAAKFLLVPSTSGLTSEFRKTASYLGVKILVPAQFFDTEMRWERAQTAASPSRRLADEGKGKLDRRVPQPFSYDYGEQRGDDLLPVLFDELRSDTGTSVHLVIGPAGMGKSFLFEALFARLYERFQSDKRNQILSRRPFALLPDHLRGTSLSLASVGSILADYLGSEFARPLGRDVFEWRLTNGSALWMIDGLDEIIARDPDFFTDLLDLETSPGSTPAKVLICVRDSLLSTDPALREFCSEHHAEMKVYRLEPWKRETLTLFADRHFDDRDVRRRFLGVLERTPHLADLASVPFYAAVLADEVESGTLEPEAGRIELLASALDGIIEREYEKGLLDPRVVPKEDVVELLESLASIDFDQRLHGIDVGDVRDFAEIILPPDLSADDLDRYTANITQLALFVTAGEGRIRFVHEPLELYLLGRFIAGRITNEEEFVSNLARGPIPTDWVTWEVVADAVRRENRQGELLQLADRIQFRPGFNNLMRLAALLGPDEVPLRDFPLSGTDLSDVVFTGVDFSEVSFRDADLTNTLFVGCLLAGTDFKGAVLANTAFVGGTEDQLAGASFGDLSRLHSIRTPEGALDDHAAAAGWLRERTRSTEPVVEPCPAARQLNHLFRKYVNPLGQPRRRRLQERALLRGERVYDQRRTVDEAIRHGYLVGPDHRGHVERTDGGRYSELVEWVKAFTLSPGLRDLLDDLCDEPGCVHVPRS